MIRRCWPLFLVAMIFGACVLAAQSDGPQAHARTNLAESKGMTAAEVSAGAPSDEVYAQRRKRRQKSGNQVHLERFRQYSNRANQGDVYSMYQLGLYYEKGWGMPAPEPVEAYVWFGRAADNGHPDGAAAQERVARGLSPARLAEAEAHLDSARAQ